MKPVFLATKDVEFFKQTNYFVLVMFFYIQNSFICFEENQLWNRLENYTGLGTDHRAVIPWDQKKLPKSFWRKTFRQTDLKLFYTEVLLQPDWDT